MKTETSLAKLEANQKNAQLSTGPKSPQGKAAVRWNAMKHGLLAKEVVIRTGDGRESKTEFSALLTSLKEDLQPEGVHRDAVNGLSYLHIHGNAAADAE